MKKFIVLFLAFAFVVALHSGSYAAMSGTAHDFSAQGWNTSGEMCLVCHIPHNADGTVAEAPLWNHEVTASVFTPYSSATLNASPGQPAGVSKLCLSCHDGTVALDSFGGTVGSTPMPAGPANFGTDLSDDHPISFTYDSALASADGELVDPSADGDIDANTVGAAAPYVPLFAGSLECATCHDVHNSAGNPKLLIVNNAGSALCLKCHNK